MVESPLIKRFLIVTIILSSLSLYTFLIIPARVRNMIELMAVGFIVFALLLYHFFGENTNIKKNYKIEVVLFLLATFFSMFIAYAYHGQSFGITFLAQRYMYFYFFYFFLHFLKINPEEIKKLIVYFGLIYVFLYLLQFAVHPVKLFENEGHLARGTLRIGIPGIGYALLAYYLFLQNYLKSLKLKDAMLALLFFTITAIFSGTRSLLAPTVFVSVLFVFFSRQVRSRTFVISMAVIAAVSLFFIFQDIFIEMITVTERQTSNEKTDIRILSMIFYLTDFMPSKLAYIFGNGQDSLKSEFGLKVFVYRSYMGFYQSDIGIIGEYSKYGILYVIAQISILFRIIFGKIPKQVVFVRYFFISSLLTLFLGTSSFGGGGGIVYVCMMLYMIDAYKEKNRLDELKLNAKEN